MIFKNDLTPFVGNFWGNHKTKPLFTVRASSPRNPCFLGSCTIICNTIQGRGTTLWSHLSFVCFIFQTGFLCVTLPVQDLDLYTRVALSPEILLPLSPEC